MPNVKSTRTANGAGSIRQRSDGRWQGIITVGVDFATGKPKKKSIYGKTQKEVRQKMSKAITQIDEGTYTDTKRITLGQWMDEWINEFCRDVKPYTLNNYRNTIAHVKRKLNTLKLSDVTTVVLQKFFNSLSDEGYAKSSIALYRRVIGIALNKAVELGYTKTNPAKGCKLSSVTRSDEMHTITGDKLTQFIALLQNDKYKNLFLVAIFTGLRSGELLGLTWDEIDFGKACIHIVHQLQWRKEPETHWELTSPKSTGSARYISVADSVMKLLQQQKDQQLSRSLETQFVFCDFDGKPIRSVTMHRHLKTIVSQIGLPNVRIHDLRHTYATLSLENGDDLKTVSENLGHSNVAITGNVYAHVTEQLRRASANRMQNRIDSIVGQIVGQPTEKQSRNAVNPSDLANP